MRARFGEFDIDTSSRELTGATGPIAVEPQVFDLLAFLVEQRHRVVPKTELLDEVWGDQFVSESALTTRVKQARKALGDDGRTQKFIRTSHGRGYRFVAEVDDASGGPSRTASDTEPPSIPSATPPPPVGELIGRENQLDRLLEVVRSERLVSVIGPGGVGKTQLTLHALRSLSGAFVNGIVVVPLADARRPADVAAAVLDVLGAIDADDARADDAIVRRLGTSNVLLVLDNAEHLVEAVGALCVAVMTRCPYVHVLVTSRERLGMVSETVIPLTPLSPDDSVDVFVRAAARVGVDLEPTQRDVRDLCRRLDGMPLALEVMAARTRVLSIADLHVDLGAHLTAAVAIDASGRHHSVEAALRWSIEALDDAARETLEALAVFAGPFDLAAAAAVAGVVDATDLVLTLCERSLVLPIPTAGTSRFRLLEPIRLIATTGGDHEGAARRRHADHYADSVERLARLAETDEIDRAYAGFGDDWSNIRAAFDTFASLGDREGMARIVTATNNYSDARLLSEGIRWADIAYAAYEEAGETPPPELTGALARLLVHRSDIERIRAITADLAPDPTSTAVSMGRIGASWYSGRAAEAIEELDGLRSHVAGTGGHSELATSLVTLMSGFAVGDVDTTVLDRLDVMAITGGDIASIFGVFSAAARARHAGRPAEAIAEVERAVAKADAARLHGFAQAGATLAAGILREIPDAVDRAQAIAASLRRGLDYGAWSMMAEDLIASARFLARTDPALALTLLGAVESAGYRSRDEPTWATDAEDRIGDDGQRYRGLGRHVSIPEGAALAIERLTAL